MGMCCEKKTLIGWRNVWNMRSRAPGQEVDQIGHGERLCKNLNKEDAMDRGRWKQLIRMVGGWLFLLVPGHPGSPGQRAVKQLFLLLLLLQLSLLLAIVILLLLLLLSTTTTSYSKLQKIRFINSHDFFHIWILPFWLIGSALMCCFKSLISLSQKLNVF